MTQFAETETLRIAYEAFGAPDGPAVFLIHGWPDSASSWRGVAERLAGDGFRVIVPSLRGFGETRFLREETARTADPAILATDMMALADALGIQSFDVAGHDWGASVTEALAVGWPDRIKRITLLSSPPRIGGLSTPGFPQAQRYWYQWFLATERGAEAVRADSVGFARLMWTNWSPQGWFTEAMFADAAQAWANPDFVDITIHSYRVRWGEAAADPRGAALGERIRTGRALSHPAIFIGGGEDGVVPPEVTEEVGAKFSGPFRRVILPGVGHFPHLEAPAQVAVLLKEHFGAPA